ncbi:MAG: UbiA family prenyltransferase [Bacteroidota bacterium]|nr:UbiA family prenyltransferase [Bacteroidota bacterium]
MVKNYLKSIRFVNLILLFLLVWGLLFQIKSKPFFLTINLNTFLLSISIILTTASGYLINNFFDFNSDAINGKNQFYFSKSHYLISYIIHVILSFFFIFISDLSGAWIQLVFYCHMLVLFYSVFLQHIPLIGNLAVAILCGIVVYIPHILLVGFQWNNNFNLQDSNSELLVIFSMLFTLARELIKDVEDLQGDQKTNSNTIAVAFGVKTSKTLIISVFFISFLTLIYSCFLTPITVNSLCFFIPTLVITGILILNSIKSNSKIAFNKLSKLVKIQFLIATVWLYYEVIT